jgi:hypothetical protein
VDVIINEGEKKIDMRERKNDDKVYVRKESRVKSKFIRIWIKKNKI